MREQGGGRPAERHTLGRADRREALRETEVQWEVRVRCSVGSSVGEGPVSLDESAKGRTRTKEWSRRSAARVRAEEGEYEERERLL